MSEQKGRQTHTTGEVFVHPRGERYRDNYCRVYGCRPFCGCETTAEYYERTGANTGVKCEDKCEGCKCQGNSTKDSEKSSDA